MNPKLLSAIQTIQGPASRAFREAFMIANDRFVNYDDYTRQVPDRTISGLVTELAKTKIREIPGVSEVDGPRDEFLLDYEGEVFRFRLNRARLDGDAEGYDAEDLESPRGNSITARSGGPRIDFAFLWVAEGGEFLDVWAVEPKARLTAQDGTQLAAYRRVRGRRWAGSYRLPATAAMPLVTLNPEPITPVVDLKFDDEDGDALAKTKKA